MLKAAIASTFLLGPTHILLAHSGHHHHHPTGGGWEGFLHPFTGLDHLLALLAVGIWCALQNRGQAALSGLALASGMVIGALAGLGSAGGHWMELSIAASVLAMGLLIIFRQVTVGSATVVAGLVGAIHGLAHGAEMPAHGQAGFVLGFVVASSLIFLIGRLATRAGAALIGQKVTQLSFGGMTALAGAVIAATVLR